MLTKTQRSIIENIIDDMYEVLDLEVLRDIYDEPYNSSEGIAGNDLFFELLVNVDWDEVFLYAHKYLGELL